MADSDLKSYYEIHKDKFVKSVGRWVSHIFINERSKALKVLNMVLDDPRGFAQVAKEHSEHPATKIHGGDMRYLDKTEVTPQMHQIVETLQEGEVHPELISGVNNNGYHILRYVKTVPEKVSSFSEVRDRLHQLLLKDQQNKLLTSFINKVMKLLSVMLTIHYWRSFRHMFWRKYQSLGNDFLIAPLIDYEKRMGLMQRKTSPAWVQPIVRLCDRKRGFGADGVILHHSLKNGTVECFLINWMVLSLLSAVTVLLALLHILILSSN